MRILAFFLALASAFAADPAPAAVSEATKREYTKALLDLANAQQGRLSLIEQIKKAQADSDAALDKAQAAMSATVQKAAKECGEKAQLDGKQLQESGVLVCVTK